CPSSSGVSVAHRVEPGSPTEYPTCYTPVKTEPGTLTHSSEESDNAGDGGSRPLREQRRVHASRPGSVRGGRRRPAAPQAGASARDDAGPGRGGRPPLPEAGPLDRRGLTTDRGMIGWSSRDAPCRAAPWP